LDFGVQKGRRQLKVKTKAQRPKLVFLRMILAKVVGNIVATQKNARYESARVMLCEQITPEGEASGNTVLALDAVDAGVGDTVLIVQEGWSASTTATGKAGAAIDSAIVGVVDRIDLL
jgi:ethanolamine utilization protein EutN